LRDDRQETVRLMLSQGSDLLDRMNSRIDSIISKSQALLSTMLAILALSIAVIIVLDEHGLYLTVAGWSMLILTFYLPMAYAVYGSSRLVHVRKYHEIAAFKKNDFELLVNARSDDVAIHLLNETRKTLDSLESDVKRDLKIHKQSAMAFDLSLTGGLLFIIFASLSWFG